jgi:hypothetical protein
MSEQNNEFTKCEKAVYDAKMDLLDYYNSHNMGPKIDKNTRIELITKLLAQSEMVRAIESAVTINNLYSLIRAHIYLWLKEHDNLTSKCGEYRTYFNFHIQYIDGKWYLGTPINLKTTLDHYPEIQQHFSVLFDKMGMDSFLKKYYKYINTGKAKIINDMIHKYSSRDKTISPEAYVEYWKIWIEKYSPENAKKVILDYIIENFVTLNCYEIIFKQVLESSKCGGITYMNVTLSDFSQKDSYHHSVVIICDSSPDRPDLNQPYNIEYFDPNGYMPGKRTQEFKEIIKIMNKNIKDEDLESITAYAFDYIEIETLLQNMFEGLCDFRGKIINASLKFPDIADVYKDMIPAEWWHSPGIQSSDVPIEFFSKQICALYCTWYIYIRSKRSIQANKNRHMYGPTNMLQKITEEMRYFYHLKDNHFIIIKFAKDLISSIKLKTTNGVKDLLEIIVTAYKERIDELFHDYKDKIRDLLSILIKDNETNNKLSGNDKIYDSVRPAFWSEVVNGQLKLLPFYIWDQHGSELIEAFLGKQNVQTMLEMIDSWATDNPIMSDPNFDPPHHEPINLEDLETKGGRPDPPMTYGDWCDKSGCYLLK